MHRLGGSLGLALGPALVLGLLSTGCNDATEGQEVFQADLSGGNEVPARETGATGVCGFVVTGNRVNFSITTAGLSSGVVSLVVNPAFNDKIPAEVRARMTAAEEQIENGSLKVTP